jgi:hypothetical protein
MFQSAAPGPQSSVIYFDSTTQVTQYSAGSRSWRTSNPGLVGMSTLTAQHGALGSALGVAVFRDPEAGRRALVATLGDESFQSVTVAQALSRFIPGYTPPSRETDPATGEPQPWHEPETGIDLELTMSSVGGPTTSTGGPHRTRDRLHPRHHHQGASGCGQRPGHSFAETPDVARSERATRYAQVVSEARVDQGGPLLLFGLCGDF